MGCGKSTLGAIVANVLGYHFIDLDDVLVQTLQMPIKTYFALYGEEAFRNAEHQALLKTVNHNKTIFALGGGAVVNKVNSAFILENGVGIYLKLSPEILSDRLKCSTERPLLLDENGKLLSDEARLAKITTLLAQRAPFYEKMPLHFNAEGLDLGGSVDALVKLIKRSVKKV